MHYVLYRWLQGALSPAGQEPVRCSREVLRVRPGLLPEPRGPGLRRLPAGLRPVMALPVAPWASFPHAFRWGALGAPASLFMCSWPGIQRVKVPSCNRWARLHLAALFSLHHSTRTRHANTTSRMQRIPQLVFFFYLKNGASEFRLPETAFVPDVGARSSMVCARR